MAEAIACLAGEESQKARALLIERNLRLVVYIAKKFENTGVGVVEKYRIEIFQADLLLPSVSSLLHLLN